jgi:hypothetical protein
MNPSHLPSDLPPNKALKLTAVLVAASGAAERSSTA